MRFSLLLPVVAFAVGVLADVPPACLLQAVNTQDNPSDLAAVCGGEATDVQKAIASLCGNNQAVAQSAFISTCSGAGSSVAPYTATSKGAGPTSSGAGPTTTNGGSASATNTAGSSSATGNAAADPKQVGSFVAAAIAIAGVVAVL